MVQEFISTMPKNSKNYAEMFLLIIFTTECERYKQK